MQFSIRNIKLQARKALKGRWFQPIWLLVTSFLLVQLLGSLLSSGLGQNSFIETLLFMLLNYFLLFSFKYGQYYYPNSVFAEQPFRFSMLFIGLSPLYYKRFVILNFIESVLLMLRTWLIFIPFIGSLSLLDMLQINYGMSSVKLLTRIETIIAHFDVWHLTGLILLLVLAGILWLWLNGFFQIAAYLVFENGQNSRARILSATLLFMHHHWLDLLKLQLSFIGWYLFFPVTFLWLIPYRQMAIFIFYVSIKHEFMAKLAQVQADQAETLARIQRLQKDHDEAAEDDNDQDHSKE
ncbi:DUF975 family protein [Agrilactobacillus fermenti]|uniref:DUF975 family protein n=1 Tax=Agrilactobacillus fermenti TaxID=2586909 RepID=UPI001E5FAEDD|nr:DUF975 family protein [Agrilactobacillus fermenti]MCD2255464.1 DUF975 family protein [Agrilactobacillus fermenti]